MGGYNGNAVPNMSKDSIGRCEKFELVPKTNEEDGHGEQISCDEYAELDHATNEEQSRKQKRIWCNHTRDVLPSAQIYCLRDDCAKCLSNFSVSSSERKRRLANLLDNLIQKRQKHHMNSSDLYAQLNLRTLTADGSDCHEERSGSSGKRSRDSYLSEAALEREAFSDDSAAKRRKIEHASNNIQLKMLGPLKLPDYVKVVEYDSQIEPEIVRLNKQLFDINRKLRAGGTIDRCPEDELSPSALVYNESGIRVNTRKSRIRAKLGHRRQQIICELNQKIPLFRHPSDDKPSKFSRKLYIPVKQYPNYNFIGLIIGPRGHTQKRMEKESGARILLRGKGSTRLRKTKQHRDSKTEPIEEEDLHVYIEAEDENSLESASGMVEKLLVPMNEEVNEHKHAQLRELAELKMEISSEVLNATPPLNLTASGAEVENSSHQPVHISSTNINSEKIALTSPDTKLDSASGAFISLDTKTGEVIDKTKLFVGFLPPSLNTERLIELFLPFGRLCEAVVITDRRTGQSKGYGFVKYIDHLSASKALVHMSGFSVDGKMINVRFAGRAPLKINTIVGPRALRFANSQGNPVSEARCPCAFSQRFVTSGWSYWATIPEHHTYFPKCNAFSSCADSMYR